MSLSFNGGYIHSNGSKGGYFDISSLNTKGYKIETEGKYFLGKRKIYEPAIFLFWPHILQFNTQRVINSGYYLSIAAFYQNTNTEREERVLDYIDNNPFPNTAHYKHNSYNVIRGVSGFNFRIGYQCIKKSNFIIDYSVGLGIRHISSRSINKMGENRDKDVAFPLDFVVGRAKEFDNGNAVYPDLSAKIKIGWAF
jgi:hypothetical protein